MTEITITIDLSDHDLRRARTMIDTYMPAGTNVPLPPEEVVAVWLQSAAASQLDHLLQQADDFETGSLTARQQRDTARKVWSDVGLPDSVWEN